MRVVLCALLLSGCDLSSRETLVDETRNVGRFRLLETVVRTTTIHDPIYSRTYEAWSAGEWTTLARTEDEDSTTVADSTPPTVVQDHLVVFLGRNVFVLRPDRTVAQLTWSSGLQLPYEADSKALRIRGATWEVDFAVGDEVITARSDDRGQTWRRASP
ncbi:MAG: hypothetical protein AAGE52_37720 [Myxococcota bacterium]